MRRVPNLLPMGASRPVDATSVWSHGVRNPVQPIGAFWSVPWAKGLFPEWESVNENDQRHSSFMRLVPPEPALAMEREPSLLSPLLQQKVLLRYWFRYRDSVVAVYLADDDPRARAALSLFFMALPLFELVAKAVTR